MLGWYYVIWLMYVDNEGCRCLSFFSFFLMLVFNNGHEKHPFGYVMDFEIYFDFYYTQWGI